MIQALDRYLVQTRPPGNFLGIPQSLSSLSARDLLNTVISWMLFVAGAIAVIYLIWSGYQYITAAGDPEKATKAKNAIVHAVIGIIVIVLSFAILRTVVREAGSI